MSSLNKVMLIGNLGADPEIRSTNNGSQVANFSLATSEKWKDKNTGEQKERTEWHRVVIWSEGLVRVVEQYLKKGSKVYIEGEIQTRKWQDQEGNDRYSTEIVLTGFSSTLKMLDTKGGGIPDSNDNSSRPGNDDPSSGRPGADRGAPDDDIPF